MPSRVLVGSLCGTSNLGHLDMKRAVIVVSVILGVIALGVLTLVLMPPVQYVTGIVARQVKEATGRELSVGGPVSLSVLPSPRLRMENVSLAGTGGGGALLTARAIEGEMSLGALISRSANLASVKLDEPKLALDVDGQGKGNWDFASPSASAQTSGGAGAFSVGSLSLNKGSVSYRDARSRQTLEVQGLDGTATQIGADGFGDVKVNGGKIALAGEAGAALGLEGFSFDARGFKAGVLETGVLKGRAVTGSGGKGAATAKIEAVEIELAKLSAEANLGAVKVKGAKLAVAAEDGGRIDSDGFQLEGSELKGGTLGVAALRSGAVAFTAPGGTPAGSFDGVEIDAKGVTAAGAAEVVARAAVLHLKDAETAAVVDFGKPELKAAPAPLNAPINLAIAFDVKNERVAGDFKLASLSSFGEAGPSPISLSVSAPKGSLAIDGRFSKAGRIEGKASAAAPSLRNLAQWLGYDLPKGSGYGAVAIEGQLTAESKKVVLDDARMALDATKASGSLIADLSGGKPRLSGSLTADQVDLDSLGVTKPRAKAAAVMLEATGPAEPVTSPVAVKDALKVYLKAQLQALESGADDVDVSSEDLQAAGAAAGAAAAKRKSPKPKANDWSAEPIDLTPLKSADVDMTVSVGKLKGAGFEIGVPKLKADLKDGLLNLDARDVGIEGGKVSGTATVDARAPAATVSTRLNAEGVDTLEVLDALGLTGIVAGKSVVEANLTGTAGSQKQLVETVSGGVKVKMGKGAIVGYDFNDIWSWIFGERRFDARRRSAFDKLEADVALKDGVARDTKMNIAGPVLGLAADGTTKLPSREIDYRARLNLAAWFQPIALRVFGQWQNPSFTPDLTNFTRSPGVLASPLDALKGADLKDAELAQLAAAVIAKGQAKGAFGPEVMATLRGLKDMAETAK